MDSKAHATSSSPGRDTALRQLMRPLAPYLRAPEVTELAVNKPGELWARTSEGWVRHELGELSAEYLTALVTALAVYNGLPLRSVLSVVLPDGERGQIVRSPACIEGMAPLTIRKHLRSVLTLDQLEASGTFLATRDVSFNRPSAAEATSAAERHDVKRLEPFEVELLALKREGAFGAFMRTAVRCRRNIVLAGKTNGGKTTLMRSLIEEVPTSERIVTIEDVHELQLPNHPNRIHMLCGEGEGRVSADACLGTCMRLSPDRIFLAELRGSEAWNYVMGMNTGHPGSVTSTHANSAVQAFDRLANLIKNSEAGRGLDIGEIRRVLYSTVDVVAFVAERKVTELFYDPVHARDQLA